MKEFDVFRIYDVYYKDTIFIRRADIKFIRKLSDNEREERFPFYERIYVVNLNYRIDNYRDYLYCEWDDICKFYKP